MEITTAVSVPATPQPIRTEVINLDLIDIPEDSRDHDPQEIEKLVCSMTDGGQFQPIAVKVQEGTERYELIFGKGRILAARKLGKTNMEAKIYKGLTPYQQRSMIFSENEARERPNPIYQARQLKAMLDSKEVKNQAELAKKKGMSEALISDYLRFLQFPVEAVQIFSALKIALRALQAVKSLSPDLQVQVARDLKEGRVKPEGVEKRCNQLRFGKGKAKPAYKKQGANDGDEVAEVSDDPMADIWQPMLMHNMASGRPWGVTYGNQQIPGTKGVTLPTWQFWVVNNGMFPRSDMKCWAQMIIDAIGDTDKEEKQRKAMMTHWVPANQQEAEQMMHDMGNIKLPQNPEETSELEKLSDQGPEAVFGWIYGNNGFYAMKARGLTWQDLGVKDPKTGLQETIKGLKLAKEYAQKQTKSVTLPSEQACPPMDAGADEELDPEIAAMVARQVAKGRVR